MHIWTAGLHHLKHPLQCSLNLYLVLQQLLLRQHKNLQRLFQRQYQNKLWYLSLHTGQSSMAPSVQGPKE